MKVVAAFGKLRSQLFSDKNVSQIASKIFATQCSVANHLKLNIINKTTCRMPSANPG